MFIKVRYDDNLTYTQALKKSQGYIHTNYTHIPTCIHTYLRIHAKCIWAHVIFLAILSVYKGSL